MRKGLVVSDLHILSTRSDGEALLDGISETMDSFDLVVFNGDTFDFRWSGLADHESSIGYALSWIEDWLGKYPETEMHFVIGNHDCHRSFVDHLHDLSDRVSSFHVHADHLVIGEHLFLHGDCANRKMNGVDLAKFRAAWSRDSQKGGLARRLYALVDALGLGLLFHRLYFPTDVAVGRLAAFLDDVEPGWDGMIKSCFFGHTHMPIDGWVYRGVQFNNTGSGIRGMGFKPIEFVVSPGHGPHRGH